jgi:nucleoside-diphosphate-sugar epimerase
MILVTGASGLLGAELTAQLLEQGKKVKAIYHKRPVAVPAHPNLMVVQCDILDVIGLQELMQDVEEVYHCAGLVSFTPGNAQMLFKVNVEGTANIVNASLDAGVKKLLHVSSVAALGRIRDNEIITESMQWTEETSNSRYGQTKYLGELEVWRGIAEGLPAVIVNPSIIIGAGDWNDGSTGIFKSVYDEFPWYSEGVTGFIDVRDVGKAMIQLMDSNIHSERFILSAENASYKDVFHLIAAGFKKRPAYKKVTPFLAGFVWRLAAIKSRFTGKAALVTKETAKTALTKVFFDNSKLKKFLPSFSYRNLQVTISETCAALQQKLNNH